MKFKVIFSLFVLPVLLSACATSAHLDSVRSDYANAEFAKLTADKKSDNLDLLIGADAALQNGEFKRSDDLFETFNRRNIDPTSTSISSELGKLAGGQMASSYKPYMMDYMFVSYYQIWDAILDGRMNDARVIINQSYSRQQKMSTAYRKLVSKRQKSDLANKLKTDTSNWSAYSDIMNPALTYLAGIYFLNIGEYENARQYLVRSSGMMPENTFITSDLESAEKGIAPKNTAWIFIETGFAPRLREKKATVPWLVGKNMQLISIATSYPEKFSGSAAVPDMSQKLADIDSMFITEFKEYQINDALRAFTKAVSNSALQSATHDKIGGFGGVLSAAYSIATTNAEIRSWVTLPQRIYLLRIKKDKSGLIKLNSSDTINVDYSGNHLIYIRNNNIKKIKIKN
ncbi:MAG: hypothetical protein JW974_03465 [Alphaproteobacteria bacterium]|nr:hypothetical protein [Alphaproteobacteria bacterium]MBN2675297.1 hypothetical protein [Alphaproteobacteria bacterium]